MSTEWSTSRPYTYAETLSPPRFTSTVPFFAFGGPWSKMSVGVSMQLRDNPLHSKTSKQRIATKIKIRTMVVNLPEHIAVLCLTSSLNVARRDKATSDVD